MWWQNLQPAVYLAVILFMVIFLLMVEAIRHRYALKKIPIRIHVNGTRGKSSVTRLIAAGLRAGGYITCAKSTGTLARFIYPDGHEESIYRMGHTNIAEQIKIVAKAAKLKAQVLVIECMSLQPLLQSICELKLVRSTHGVLTNARPDHLDVMGPGEEDVALALAGTVPVKGKYFTAEKKHLAIFKKVTEDRSSSLYAVDQADCDLISNEEMAKFSYQEHKENVALALAVCESLQVDRNTALKGMWCVTPDPGAMSIYQLLHQGHQIIFPNGFAANDPVSTGMLWQNLLEQYPECEDTTLIVNCRADRHDRSAQLGEAIVKWKPPHKILLVGSGVKTFAHALNKADKSKNLAVRLVDGSSWDVAQILNYITIDPRSKQHLVVGIGNIAHIGFELVNYMRDNQVRNIC